MAKILTTISGLPNNGQKYTTADIDAARFREQFAIEGATGLKSPYFNNINASVFLEYVYADGVWVLKDNAGNMLLSSVPATVDFAHSPIRIDAGFELTGATFTVVKGFTIIG